MGRKTARNHTVEIVGLGLSEGERPCNPASGVLKKSVVCMMHDNAITDAVQYRAILSGRGLMRGDSYVLDSDLDLTLVK